MMRIRKRRGSLRGSCIISVFDLFDYLYDRGKATHLVIAVAAYWQQGGVSVKAEEAGKVLQILRYTWMIASCFLATNILGQGRMVESAQGEEELQLVLGNLPPRAHSTSRDHGAVLAPPVVGFATLN